MAATPRRGRISIEDWHEGDGAYMAPEVMKGEISKAADIFSLGITMVEIAGYLELPRHGPPYDRLRRGELPSQVAGKTATRGEVRRCS